MKVEIAFVNGEPKMSIYGLEGVVMHLYGRTEYIVSKDPMTDTLSTWFHFFIEKSNQSWTFGYKSNCEYTRDDAKRILRDLVNKANKAIKEKQSIDLSQEFNALDNNVEPYIFGGLFAQMNERYVPVSLYGDLNQDIAKMRETLRKGMTAEQLEADEHLKNFVYQIPSEIIWVDDTKTSTKT
jgi:hypothetical protein